MEGICGYVPVAASDRMGSAGCTAATGVPPIFKTVSIFEESKYQVDFFDIHVNHLHRHLPSGESAAAVDGGAVSGGLKVRVSLGTYRLFFESGTEDTLVRIRSTDEQTVLEAKAVARAEERARRGRAYL
jgi:hypothetical protein